MTTMLPEFPFVPLPFKHASDMLRDQPLLLKTILWICRPPPPEVSAAFESWFRQHVAEQTVVLMNKNIELVQAILVFLAWNDINFYATIKDTALVQLASGLVRDLNLTRPQWREDLAFESIVEDAAQTQNKLPPRLKQTGADCRTLMGVYYMTSSLSSLLGKRCILEYTAHVDDCYQQLRRDEEYATDSLLLPTHLKWNHLLRTHCASIRIRLFEPFKFGDNREMPGPSHLRCRTIWDCLQSTHELYDAFRLVPVESIPSLTVISVLHIALAIIKASRLLCVEDRAWDLITARTMFSLPGILQLLSKVFEDASSSGSARTQRVVHGLSIFSEYAEAYRGIERAYIARLNSNDLLSSPLFMDPVDPSGGDHDFGFWNQLSDLTNGVFP
ncbi:hypothetical protein BO71DRAFT_441330 [Aspergillus ellipticus CBS 707.79]|uniref:Transcription factor domain-containing protein n=1 Tax=Aspergillus ellipticus CBS 707.79 TaxID=1448320 RepID=A0A319D9B2_9EURO|nr:hypothetical protein BO71DRAFT_441330 [Aspergillus ellipticus CBS 707.79]